MQTKKYKSERIIYDTSWISIQRALDLVHDNRPVIIKTLKSPSKQELTDFKKEYEIGKCLSEHRLYGSCRIEQHDNELSLIFDDFGGESLEHFLSDKFSIEQSLELGLKIIDRIEKIHRAEIIHKNINPSNIIWNPGSGQLEIIDFCEASVIPSELPVMDVSKFHRESLNYISPEQTGRINRKVDYRSDFYSFGATLYEMLTTTPPFQANSDLELIHSHIARTPHSPSDINPEIPESLANIVMRLLAKSREDRYQSCQGIRVDLQRCLDQIKQGNKQNFTIGMADIPGRFHVSPQLYGRESEIEYLLKCFKKTEAGENKAAFIGGYSGCGKTTLVREMFRPITEARGIFVSDKFDQFQRSIPYSAIIQVFSTLIKYYLGENEKQILKRRNLILEAVGSYGQLIIDKLPMLEKIIGPQPQVPEVGMVESQNRFQRIFRRFVSACIDKAHPLTIFLDDLQWADHSSLEMLKLIITDPKITHLFVIGAYRDNEVYPEHPLMTTLKEIETLGGTFEKITLGSLKSTDVEQLTADTLLMEKNEISDFTELIIAKTGGNPFFINQFFEALYEEELIYFNNESGFWDYSIDGIKKKDITSNVVDLMISRLEKLPKRTQQLLSRAACIGNKFTLKTLSTIDNSEVPEAYRILFPADKAGLIQRVSEVEQYGEGIDTPLIVNEYRFLHDKVQEAAYRLIPESDRPQIHLESGMLMWKDDPEFKQNTIFDVTNHLNTGSSLLTKDNEIIELARLNLKAAASASKSNAVNAALIYAETGSTLIADMNPWQNHHALFIELRLIQSDCLVFNGKFDEAQEILTDLLEHISDELERAKAYERRLQIFVSNNQMEEALELTTGVLSKWGIKLTKEPSEQDWRKVHKRFEKLLSGRSIEQLLDVPDNDNPKMQAALRLLMNTLPASYQTRSRRPYAMITLMTEMMNIGLEYGYSDISAYAYSAYIYCITDQDRYEEAFRFGQLAMRLNDRKKNAALTGKLLIYFSCYAQFWREHFSLCEPNWNKSYMTALESGDLIHVAFLFLNKTPLRIAQSVPLNSLIQETLQSVNITDRTNYRLMLYIIQMDLNLIRNLNGTTEGMETLDHEDLREKEYLTFMSEQNNAMGMAYYHAAKLVSFCYYGNYRKALEHGKAFESHMLTVPGMIVLAEHGFYYALSIIALWDEFSEQDKEFYGPKFDHYLEKSKIWAENCPDNFKGRHLLLLAERSRIKGLHQETVRLYLAAAEAAEDKGFFNIQALGNERLAFYWKVCGFDSYAHFHLKKALLCYRLWEADGKVKALTEEYPDILQTDSLSAAGGKSSRILNFPAAKAGFQNANLNLEIILELSRTISSEILLDKLVARILTNVMKISGAQMAMLLSPDDDGHFQVQCISHVSGYLSNDKTYKTNERYVFVNDKNKFSLYSYPETVIQYVKQTKDQLKFDDAIREQGFDKDPVIQQRGLRSVFCLPVMHQSKIIAILYLENNLTTGAFNEGHSEILNVLCSQAAISLENARLYHQLENYSHTLEKQVAERTKRLSQLNKKLDKMAYIDGLTRIANRRSFDDYARKTWKQCKRSQTPLTIIMSDIDFFKKYNDGYGHQAGDECLKAIAQAMQNKINRPTDLLARYGGEEFIIILPETDDQGGFHIANKILKAVEGLGIAHEFSMVKDIVTISLGVATVVPNDKNKMEELIEKADTALYQAKSTGRNKIFQ